MLGGEAMQRQGSLDSSQHSETTGTLRGGSSSQRWRQQSSLKGAPAAPPGVGKRVWSRGALPTGNWRHGGAASAGTHPAKHPRLTAAALARHDDPPPARLYPTDGAPPEALPFVTSMPEGPIPLFLNPVADLHDLSHEKLLDAASETGSSSTPPPRKRAARRSTPVRCPARVPASSHRQGAARELPKPPATPRVKRNLASFPWSRAAACQAVQGLLGSQPPLGTQALDKSRELPAQPGAPLPLEHHQLAAPKAHRHAMCAHHPSAAAAADALVSSEGERAEGLAGSLPTGQGDWSVQIWPEPPKGISFGAAAPASA